MNTPEENTFVDRELDTLAQKVIDEYRKERKYDFNATAGNEIFFLDEKKNFLILAGKRENSDYYIVALKEVGREIHGGFVTEVYSKNGGDCCKKLFSREFNDSEYGRARSDAASFTRRLRDSEDLRSELG